MEHLTRAGSGRPDAAVAPGRWRNTPCTGFRPAGHNRLDSVMPPIPKWHRNCPLHDVLSERTARSRATGAAYIDELDNRAAADARRTRGC